MICRPLCAAVGSETIAPATNSLAPNATPHQPARRLVTNLGDAHSSPPQVAHHSACVSSTSTLSATYLCNFPDSPQRGAAEAAVDRGLSRNRLLDTSGAPR